MCSTCAATDLTVHTRALDAAAVAGFIECVKLVPTVLLALLFVLASLAFLAGDSLLRHLSDPTAVAQSARRAGLRRTLVSAAAEHLTSGLAERPELEMVSQLHVRAAIESVITDAWVDERVKAIHGTLLGALAMSDDPAVLDLGPTKVALAGAVDDLEHRARAQCRDLFPGARCDDREVLEGLIRSMRARTAEVLASIPDQVDLLEDMEAGERARAVAALADARGAVGILRIARWAGLAGLLLLLAGIVLINVGTPGRAMIAAGVTVAVAAGLYLATAAVMAGPVRREADRGIEEAMQAERGEKIDPVEAIMAEGGARLGVGLTADALWRPVVPVAIAGGGGLLLIVAGLLIGAGRRRGRAGVW